MCSVDEADNHEESTASDEEALRHGGPRQGAHAEQPLAPRRGVDRARDREAASGAADTALVAADAADDLARAAVPRLDCPLRVGNLRVYGSHQIAVPFGQRSFRL